MAQFSTWLNRKGIALSPGEKARRRWSRHAWDLAHFRLDSERQLSTPGAGKRFLLDPETRFPEPLRFWLKADYAGWPYLLEGYHPLEWDRLDDKTRVELIRRSSISLTPWAAWFSDGGMARAICEALENWFTGVSEFLQPTDERGKGFYDDRDEDVRSTFEKIADLLQMMAEERHQSTPLFDCFRGALNPRIKAKLPTLLDFIASTLDVRIELTV